MDFLKHVPSWDDVERNLDHRFNEINQSIDHGLQSANDSWDGFTRRIGSAATTAYGYAGGSHIDSLRLAVAMSYPIVHADLTRKWASIEIEKILPVLMQLIREVVMIVGGSVAVGTLAGGIAGSMAFGAGAAPGAMIGGSIGLQVGNLILTALGLAAISEYFCRGLMPCVLALYEGVTMAWCAEDGLTPAGLDPTGGSAAMIDERLGRAARQLASGQEQLVLLLFTAIVSYLNRGRIVSGVLNTMETVATRSASLQAGMPNRELAAWLERNQQKMLSNPELRVDETNPSAKVAELDIEPSKNIAPSKYAKRTDIEFRSAAEVNSMFPEGWSPPYKPGTRVTEFTSTVDGVYVRVHGETNMARSWMMKSEAIKGLTAAEIKSKFALPELPTFMSEVSVPAGTRIRTGVVNPVFGGTGNATQYELLQRLPTSAFKNTIRLGQ
jgi:hypothetical protein